MNYDTVKEKLEKWNSNRFNTEESRCRTSAFKEWSSNRVPFTFEFKEQPSEYNEEAYLESIRVAVPVKNEK